MIKEHEKHKLITTLGEEEEEKQTDRIDGRSAPHLLLDWVILRVPPWVIVNTHFYFVNNVAVPSRLTSSRFKVIC